MSNPSETSIGRQTERATADPDAPRLNDARRVGGWFRRHRRAVLLTVLGGMAVAAVLIGAGDVLSFETLREHRHALMAFVDDNAVLSVLTFMAIYALTTALSVPGGTVLSIAGGYLFGTALGTVWIVVGATVGAVAIFLAARSALGQVLRARAAPWLRKLEGGFQENAFSYLLVLRLVPLFPFFVVNLVPAFLGMRLGPYTLATAVGIVPGAFVFASVGTGLGSVFEAGGDIGPAAARAPEVVTALVGLGALSLLPIAYRKLRARRSAA